MFARFSKTILVLAALLSLAGCARAPQGGPGATRRLLITMRVAGSIEPNKFYFVAIDNDSDTNDGPLAVVSGPGWGNGWGTGSISHFVQFDSGLPQGGYGVFRIPDETLLGKVYLGPPVFRITPSAGGNTLEFAIDLDTIILPPQTTGTDIQTLDINFITTDVLPIDPAFVGPRQWDALGDHLSNNFLRLNVTPGQTISNTTEGLEPENDVPDPDLDIVDWSIEVQQL